MSLLQLCCCVGGIWAELTMKAAGVLPWYPLNDFDMAGLPCVLKQLTTSSLKPGVRFSTNHTAAKQSRDRDGAPIARRLRNIVIVVHQLPPEDEEEEQEEEKGEWLLAVSLLESQSFVLLLRDETSSLAATALGLVRVEDGALLASTALYRQVSNKLAILFVLDWPDVGQGATPNVRCMYVLLTSVVRTASGWRGAAVPTVGKVRGSLCAS